MTTSFFVPGIPAPQGSKRYLGVKGGKGITVESSKRVAPWRADVRAAAQEHCEQPLDGPLTVVLRFYLPRPQSHYYTGKRADVLREDAPQYVSKRPDIDKLSRAVLDALKGIAWHDDAQVAELWSVKRYGFVGLQVDIVPTMGSIVQVTADA